jgi:hypothetical protein
MGITFNLKDNFSLLLENALVISSSNLLVLLLSYRMSIVKV